MTSRIDRIHNEYYDYDRYLQREQVAITILKEKRVRARLSHTCHCCGRPINPGERYTYFFIKDEESIPPRAFASHQHLFCPIE